MTRGQGAARRPAAVRAMALMCAVSAAGGLVSAAAPMTPEAPVHLAAAGGLLAAALGLAVWLRPSPALLHVGVVVHAVGLAALVAASATGTGAAALTVGHVWVGLYAACFLGARAARAHTAVLAASLAAGLALDPFPGAAHVGVLVGGTLVLASLVVARLVERLEHAASRDPLTGLLNRAGFAAAAVPALEAARRSGRPLTVVVADLDGFKQVNDRQGHAAGDALLVALGRTWRGQVRARDVVARLGGDEFALLLPDTSGEEARELVARLRGSSPAAFSAGRAVAGAQDDLDTLLLRADRDLYRSKAARSLVPAQRRPGRVA